MIIAFIFISYNYDKNNYIERLGVEIDKITHTQTRAIFKHALTYYKDNKMNKIQTYRNNIQSDKNIFRFKFSF